MRWHDRPVAAVANSAALSDARELIVRPKFRRAVVAAVLFVAAASTSVALGGLHAKHKVEKLDVDYRSHQLGSAIAIAVCVISGFLAVQLVANEIARLARHRGSPAAASSLRLAIEVIGYLAVIVTFLGLLAVRIESVLLSGAIGSVVLGLAAQQSLGNAFAGMVLLVSRPFVVGDYITLRAGALGGQYDGQVVSITLMFTIMSTAEGPITLPNAAVLASATGRREGPTTDSLLH